MTRPHRVGKQPGNPAADLNAAQREATAFRLRAQGYEWTEIAEQCGYIGENGQPNPGSAYKAWKRALHRIPLAAVEEMRREMFSQQVVALRALSHRIAKGDTYAIREMTMMHDRIAKLFGLDAPPAERQTAQVMIVAVPQSVGDAV